MGNQFGFYEGIPIEISDFRFETDASQQILKNGLQLVRDLGDGVFIDAGVAYTNLLNDAAIDDYWTPFAGIGGRLGKAIVRAGYRGDFGDDSTSHGGEVSLVLFY
jgi:hypothetical protein